MLFAKAYLIDQRIIKMKKNIFIYVGVALVVVAIIAGIGFTLSEEKTEPFTLSLADLEFTYTESNLQLKQDLESQNISMSSPLKLKTISDINEHCTFFQDRQLQSLVKYCTSTELLDSEGKFLGNIHMVGNNVRPKIILTLAQSDPFMENLDAVKTLYSTVVNDLVCDCWADVKPNNLETVSEWIDKQREFHTSGSKPTSKSSLSLSDLQLQMELTTNTQGYLWKLIISN